MKTLLEVLAGIEDFKKDMEDLGVDVSVYHGVDTREEAKSPAVTVISIVIHELEEDLEVEA